MTLSKIIMDTVRVMPEIVPHLSPDAQRYVLLHRERKAESGDLASINAPYHDAITEALTTFFEGGSIAGPRNAFKRATSAAFLDAFELGWAMGGGSLPIDEDALSWLDARLNQEFGYIDMLFQEAKELRKEDGFDSFTWSTARADGYTNTLREIFNVGNLRASKDKMVTFDGEDGAESCDTCQKLKGKRHKISWFVARNYVPPFGTGLECHPGKRCQHYLVDDNGEQVTI